MCILIFPPSLFLQMTILLTLLPHSLGQLGGCRGGGVTIISLLQLGGRNNLEYLCNSYWLWISLCNLDWLAQFSYSVVSIVTFPEWAMWVTHTYFLLVHYIVMSVS